MALPKSPTFRMVDPLVIGLAQALIWMLTAVGFLTTQVDRNGSYISVSGSIVYLLLCLSAIMFVPVAYYGPTTPAPAQGKLGKAKSWFSAVCKDFTRACTSPCVVLIELAVLSGNITPWVFAEPLLLAGVGNISIFQPSTTVSSEQAQLPFNEVIAVTATANPYVLQLSTARAKILVRTNLAPESNYAVITVGGVGGGFDSPANELYSALGAKFRERFPLLDVQYRQPGNLDESVYDLRMAIAYARQLGAKEIVLIGHSFGGAVCVTAALEEPSVTSVIAMSSQVSGCEQVSKLSPRSVLFIHGIFDFMNPRFCSEDLYRRARSPKSLQFVLATHLLNESSAPVYQTTYNWINKHTGK